jgi:hypothetical protein
MMSKPAFTPGPWAAVFGFGQYIVPASHEDRPIGYATNEAHDRGGYAQQIAVIKIDRHGRGSPAANATLIAAAPDLYEALKRAQAFIANGIELGFIRMPDPETPDPAHETPRIIDVALAKAEGRL